MPATRRPVLVLSLDGGGIRGHFQAQVLKYLRDRLADELGQPALELNDIFDIIAGTSTGGILACGLVTGDGRLGAAAGPKRTDTLASLYETYGRDIFAQRLRRMPGHLLRRKYPSRALERMLIEYLGASATLQVAGERNGGNRTRLLVPSYDIKQARIRWFDNNEWRSADDSSSDTPLWEVARATSAAPTFFAAARLSTAPDTGPWIDGGVGANDPSGYAATIGLSLLMSRRLSAHNKGGLAPSDEHPFVRVIAIGNTLDRRSCSTGLATAIGGGVLPWLPLLPGLLMGAHAGTASDVMQQLRSLVEVPDDRTKPVRKGIVRLHRILPSESWGTEVGLDAASKKSLKLLTDAAEAAISTKARFDLNTPVAVVNALAKDLR